MSLTIQSAVRALPRVPRKVWLHLGFVFLVLGGVAGASASIISGDGWWLHAAWCIVGLCITAPILYRCLRMGFLVVITDHLVMFTSAFSLYFLFGASFLVFGPEVEIERALGYYSVDAVAALRADAVNGLGFGLALIFAAVLPTGWFTHSTRRIAVRAARVPALSVLLILIVFGFATFTYVLAYDLGFRDGVVPGVVRAFSNFSVVAVFLAAGYRGKAARQLRVLAFLMAGLLVIAGMIMFNKTQVLISLGALVGGLCLVYPLKRVLPLGLVAIIGLYLSLGGMVLYGRNTLGDRVAPLSERWQLVGEGFSAVAAGDSTASASSWGRLCYVPSQGAGMDFYDAGMGGNDFALLPWVLVPRFLAGNKPILTQTPEIFHEKISGNSNSSTGQGIFSSGYYSAGWFGVVVVGFLAGLVLSQTSAVARAVMAYRATLLLPLALYGVYIAFRIDGSFLVDYAGAFIFLLYPLAAAWLLRLPFAKRK